MVRAEKTEPVPVCLDADVLIAGLLSRRGASHAILVLGEIGLLHLVLPDAAVDEVRRNLFTKLPEAVPLFDEFLRAVAVRIYRPTERSVNWPASSPIRRMFRSSRLRLAPEPDFS